MSGLLRDCVSGGLFVCFVSVCLFVLVFMIVCLSDCLIVVLYCRFV